MHSNVWYNVQGYVPQEIRKEDCYHVGKGHYTFEEPTKKHSHYFKPVEHLTEVDVYRVCDIFQVNDCSGATQHAIKKLLLPGQRGGGKSNTKDIKEAVDTLNRKLEMLEEDEKT